MRFLLYNCQSKDLRIMSVPSLDDLIAKVRLEVSLTCHTLVVLMDAKYNASTNTYEFSKALKEEYSTIKVLGLGKEDRIVDVQVKGAVCPILSVTKNGGVVIVNCFVTGTLGDFNENRVQSPSAVGNAQAKKWMDFILGHLKPKLVLVCGKATNTIVKVSPAAQFDHPAYASYPNSPLSAKKSNERLHATLEMVDKFQQIINILGAATVTTTTPELEAMKARMEGLSVGDAAAAAAAVPGRNDTKVPEPLVQQQPSSGPPAPTPHVDLEAMMASLSVGDAAAAAATVPGRNDTKGPELLVQQQP